MALAALSRAKPPPTRSAEREQLAEATEQLRAAIARREALTRALTSAETAAIAAARAFEAAEAAAAEAKEATARHLVEAAASGIAGDPPQSPRAARNALEDARDELDVRRAARDRLRAQLSEPDNASIYKTRLDAAIDAVLRAEAAAQAQAVVEAANTARTALVHAVLLTQFINGRNVFDRNSVNGLTNLSQWPLGDYERERPAATARWRSAIEALQTDADAVLDL